MHWHCSSEETVSSALLADIFPLRCRACCDRHPRDLTDPGSVDRVDTVDVFDAGFDASGVDVRRSSSFGDLELDERALPRGSPQYQVAR